jgi:hypothetical protein
MAFNLTEPFPPALAYARFAVSGRGETGPAGTEARL